MKLPRTLAAGAALGALLAAGPAARAETPAPRPPKDMVGPSKADSAKGAPAKGAPAKATTPSPMPPDDPAHDDAGLDEPEDDAYVPLLTARFKGFQLQAPILLAGRFEGVSSFPVDRDKNQFQSGPAVAPMLRVGLRFDTVRPIAGKILVFAEYEHDVPTGTWAGGTTVAGEGMPNSQGIGTQIRKGWGRLSLGPYLHVGGGLMTSHWGMGLVANDGAHGWEPGSARFTDPRGGNLVARGFLGMGPLTRAHITTILAVEQVRRDPVLLTGDSAYQAIASVTLGHDQPNQIGYFLVHRNQKTADGNVLDVNVMDVAGKLTIPFTKSKLTLEGEGAIVFGQTTLAGRPEGKWSDVRQLGVAARASLAYERTGGVIDLMYFSGDGNAHDGRLHGFTANPNFETGLLLFRYIQAAQTGRAQVTASDPQILGVPPGGVERLPTRGGLTNAAVIFPRLWVRPVRGLEAYGGALFAFAPAKNADPLNTDVAGGSPRNALNAAPGPYWGTELDLGVRYRLNLHGTELTAGAEGGVLLPGSALEGGMGAVYGGRVMLAYRL